MLKKLKKSYFLQSIINNQGQKEDSSFSFPCNSIGILMTLYYNSRCYGVIIHGLIILIYVFQALHSHDSKKSGVKAKKKIKYINNINTMNKVLGTNLTFS